MAKEKGICDCLFGKQGDPHKPLWELRNDYIIIRWTNLGSFIIFLKRQVESLLCLFCLLSTKSGEKSRVLVGNTEYVERTDILWT